MILYVAKNVHLKFYSESLLAWRNDLSDLHEERIPHI